MVCTSVTGRTAVALEVLGDAHMAWDAAGHPANEPLGQADALVQTVVSGANESGHR
jgi:hypothetical protein